MSIISDTLEKRLEWTLQETKPKSIMHILGNLAFQHMMEGQRPKLTKLCGILDPHYRLGLNHDSYGRGFYLSDIFMKESGERRLWTLLYVPAFEEETRQGDRRFRVVPAYESLSHGLWRILPEWSSFPEEHYSKGFTELSVTLPLVAQLALTEIRKRRIRKERFSGEVFALNVYYDEGYWNEVDPKGVRLSSPPAPAELSIYEELKPDFSNMAGPFQHMTSSYGVVDLYPVMSKDEQIMWIYSVKGDKVWIANMEHMSPLISTGTTKEFVTGGVPFIRPPMDYANILPNAKGKENGYSKTDYSSGIELVKNFKSVVLGIEG